MARNTCKKVKKLKNQLLKEITLMEMRLYKYHAQKSEFPSVYDDSQLSCSSNFNVLDNDLSDYSDNDCGDFTKYLPHCLPKCC